MISQQYVSSSFIVWKIRDDMYKCINMKSRQTALQFYCQSTGWVLVTGEG